MYFDRAELAWPRRSRALRRSRVVVGAGAIGSVLAVRLARSGVGELVLVDGDVVEPHNLERVDCYTEEDVGRPKVEALARCIRRLRRGEDVGPRNPLVPRRRLLRDVVPAVRMGI